MPNLAYRVRVRNEANTADLVTWTMDDLSSPPSGDGTEIDLATGQVRSGLYSVSLADRLISSTERTGTKWFADVSGRWRLLSRRTYVERSEDGGPWQIMFPGYITRVALPDAATVAVQIGESPRVPATALAFSVPTASTIRGCLIGGPLTADWGPLKTSPGWTMRVASVGGALSPQLVAMQPIRGAIGPNFVVGPVTPAIVDRVNKLAEEAVATRTPPYGEEPIDGRGNVLRVSRVPALTAELKPSSGATVTATPAVVGYSFSTFGFTSGTTYADAPVTLLNTDGPPAFYVDWPTSVALPSVGAQYSVRVTAVTPTAYGPAYYDAHPLTIAEELYTAAGVAVDSASFAATRTLIGEQYLLALRVTEPTALQPWLEQNIAGPLGVTFLPDTQGRIAAKLSRFTLAALPTATVTLDDVSAIGSVWAIDEGSAIARVSWSQQQFYTASDQEAVDGVLVQRRTNTVAIGDQTTYASKTLSFDVEGMYHTVGNWYADTNILGGGQIAAIASRYSRGAPTTELTMNRGRAVTDALVLGDYAQIDIPSLPMGSVRRGDSPGTTTPRVMQAIRITERPATREVLWQDAGPANNTGTTAPTLSVSLAIVGGVATASVTLSNAATLNAIPAGVVGEIAFTSGAAPSAGEWTFFWLHLVGQIPTGAVEYPVQLRDTTVWFRARAYNPTLFLPSAYSTAVSAAVSALTGVSSLAAASVAGTGTQLTLSWTRTPLDGAVYDVEARVGSAAYTPRLTAPAGSLAATLDDLAPSTSHDVRVRARIASTGAVSAWSTVTASTSAASATVADPTSVQIASDGNGTYRVQAMVAGNPLPALEADSARETSVGSGTYGSAESIGVAAADAMGLAAVSASAPNDGLRRRVRVRAVSSLGASAWVTATPDATPWTVQQVSPPGVGAASPRFTSCTVNVSNGAGVTGANITVSFAVADAPAGYTVNAVVDAGSNGISTLAGISTGAVIGFGRLTTAGGFIVSTYIRGTLTMLDASGNQVAARAIPTTSYWSS